MVALSPLLNVNAYQSESPELTFRELLVDCRTTQRNRIAIDVLRGGQGIVNATAQLRLGRSIQ